MEGLSKMNSVHSVMWSKVYYQNIVKKHFAAISTILDTYISTPRYLRHSEKKHTTHPTWRCVAEYRSPPSVLVIISFSFVKYFEDSQSLIIPAVENIHTFYHHIYYASYIMSYIITSWMQYINTYLLPKSCNLTKNNR